MDQANTDKKDHKVDDEKIPGPVKDMPDMVVEQNNSAEETIKHEKNFNLLINEYKGEALNVNVHSGISYIPAQIQFHELKLKLEKNLTSEENQLVKFQIEGAREDFEKSRIVILNNNLPSEKFELSAISQLTDKVGCDAVLLNCQVSGAEFQVEDVIDQFVAHIKRLDNNNGKKVFYNIIYRKSEDCWSIEFLQSILRSGGLAETYSETLRDHGAYLICVENDIALNKSLHQDKFHPALINLDEYHSLLFEKLGSTTKCRICMHLAEQAIGEYEWLKRLSKKERKSELVRLLEEDKLEETLENLIGNTDREENRVNELLITDPLYGSILFVGAFFEGIGMSEFHELISCLLEKYDKIQSANETNNTGLVTRWEMEADIHLDKCGIVLQSPGGGIMGCVFRSEAKKLNVKKLFSEQYLFSLVRKTKILQSFIYLGERIYSGILMKSMNDLIVFNARHDKGRDIIGLCHELINETLNDTHRQSRISSMFFRLVGVLKIWSADPLLSNYVNDFYKALIKDPSKKIMMGSLLTHLCKPSRPLHLVYLKQLLDASSEQEHFIRLRVPRSINWSHAGDLSSYLDLIETWNTEDVSNNKAYFLIKGSFALVFYERRFSWREFEGIDFATMEMILKSGSLDEFKRFSRFLFSKDLKDVIGTVFRKHIQEKSDHLDDTYQFIAFILIQWQFIWEAMKSECILPLAIEELMIESKQAVMQHYEMGAIINGFEKCIKKFNERIVAMNIENTEERGKQKILKKKRDFGRQLIENINIM